MFLKTAPSLPPNPEGLGMWPEEHLSFPVKLSSFAAQVEDG